jgi:hypothetical protein
MPAGLSPDQMAAKREVIAARLERKLSGLTQVENKMAALAFNARDERVCAEAGKRHSQCVRTSATVNRELALLWGCYAPTKLMQDMMQISYRKEEQRVVIEFDESQIAPDYSIDSGLREIGADGIARRCQPPDLPNLLGEQHRPDHDDGASTTGVAGAT